MKTLVTILIIAGLLVGGGLLLDSLGDSGSASLLSSLEANKQNGAGLKNYGPAPEFEGIHQWLNSDPLTMAELRGKVVLIDFWTYSCINCIRTLPYLTAWYEKYKDEGLVIVGVHTPEFAFEKDTDNVSTALLRHGITYPVAQDNDFGTWQAYSNRYWPAHYLIDQSGNVVYTHFGEGKYEETEKAIQTLLGSNQELTEDESVSPRQVNTPEIYFGLKRQELLSKTQKATTNTQNYTLPSALPANTFAMEGRWSFNDEFAKLVGNEGRIRLNFSSKDVHMVGQAATGAEITVIIDGEVYKTFTVTGSDLYTLFEGEESKTRILELEIKGAGFEAFTFTFG